MINSSHGAVFSLFTLHAPLELGRNQQTHKDSPCSLSSVQNKIKQNSELPVAHGPKIFFFFLPFNHRLRPFQI